MRHQRWPYYVVVIMCAIVLGALIAVSGYGGTKPPGLVSVPTPTPTTTVIVTTTTEAPPATTTTRQTSTTSR